ncbi:23S rRNA (adenine(2030)-N(6))-methyltransferase RlmJ [Vibrio lentus]|uniref:Ribosomal RNA large subunit methyltransferase J n=1 Tax=Vibrio lentus TaxID=136468 RepID=A0AA44VWK1_9VIBR|nr:23S rRNA (adenine(2030)-N(6))-methyltransferase RlmJ [Vibrio lentus]MCB5360784.1 23S rRNA (adenine(2030)-N(6))-methyltransferase RlmJ [Vibrio lentus]MCB5451994.1 23S rRNA (adenine(2030)-N(6))-methyltransferase RlmJ [Vibrio lentus]MCB5462520.1 23S rRNA (adenine(2030)-N(6))-methyltransferase RlmJ [Vibrio lentus]MCC4791970.1 23S rRNA (adenine(2030)-N(6))-methyltransferase RlmJ [Vibrio lentus]MCC4849997.1 23S rRNA (adenine(2030)-N(6))-methyltransferase RlmJ [Vibrio lentus]
MEYRHQCHVGDHGDALKHPVLSALVKSLMQQHSRLNVIDTHSGTGCYDLTTAPSNHAGEFAEGVGYLWQNKAYLPESFASFMSVLEYYNPNRLISLYPGSAAIAYQQGRSQDSFYFSDIQQDEADLLQTNIEKLQRDLDVSSKLTITAGDGLKALPDDVTKHDNHHLIVIDPPYETDSEYLAVIDALVKAYQQSEKVSALIWYPLYTDDKSSLILNHCVTAVKDGLLPSPIKSELRLRDPKGDDRLIGSGLLLFNPPQGIAGQVADTLDYLHSQLATNGEGYWQMRSL